MDKEEVEVWKEKRRVAKEVKRVGEWTEGGKERWRGESKYDRDGGEERR